MVASCELGAMADIAAEHHGVITRRVAAEHGITAGRITRLIGRGLLEEPAPGLIFVRGSPPTFERNAMAATLLLRNRDLGAMSGPTAAWIHRLDGFGRAPAEIEVTIRKGRRIATGQLPIVVRVTRDLRPAHDIVNVDGVIVTNLARTICDLAGRSGPPPTDLLDAVPSDGPRSPGGPHRGSDADVELERWIDDFERRAIRCSGWNGRRWPASKRPGRASRGARRDRATTAPSGARRTSAWLVVPEAARAVCSFTGPGELVEEFELHDAGGRFVARFDAALPGGEGRARSPQPSPSPRRSAGDPRRNPRGRRHGARLVDRVRQLAPSHPTPRRVPRPSPSGRRPAS
ncbi:MAG: hypothetical protein R2705_10965 [Ilumatobacteraceae bacterium]